MPGAAANSAAAVAAAIVVFFPRILFLIQGQKVLEVIDSILEMCHCQLMILKRVRQAIFDRILRDCDMTALARRLLAAAVSLPRPII